MLRILGLAIVLICMAVQPRAQGVEDRPTAMIGVRVDAMPFVWREYPGRETYRGFLYDLCTDATTRAGYHFELVPVTAADREAIIGGELSGEFEGLDLFCDPTTISLNRLDRLAGSEAGQSMVFSPILFVANGSYVERSEASRRKACRLAVPGGGQDAKPAAEASPLSDEELPFCDPAPDPSDCFGQGSNVLDADSVIRFAGHVRGTTARAAVMSAVSSGALRMKPEDRLCLVAQESHTSGVEAFCAQKFDYYFGDVDIIEAYIRQVDEFRRDSVRLPAGARADLRALRRADHVEGRRLPVEVHRGAL